MAIRNPDAQGGPGGCFTHPCNADTGFVVDTFTPLQRG